MNIIKNETTPMHLAVVKNNKDILKVLFASGADINFKDKYGKTPLYYALNNENLEISAFLLKLGRNLMKKLNLYYLNILN